MTRQGDEGDERKEAVSVRIEYDGPTALLPEGATFVFRTPVRFVVRNGVLVNIDSINLECESVPDDAKRHFACYVCGGRSVDIVDGIPVFNCRH